MTAPTKALDLAAALASYRTSLRKASDVELEHRAASVAALPGWFAGELRQAINNERESRRLADRPTPARTPKVAAGAAVAGAPIAVLAGRLLAEHAEQVPQVLLYSPAVAVGLVGAVVGGGRLGRWLDERRHGLAMDVDEADLNPLGKELLAQVRARRAAGGES
jgi:type II secretory pathway component PulM